MLIAFEGIDFSGKTTQITLLELEMDFNLLKFPRKESRIIREFLENNQLFSKKASFFLFLADIIDGIEKSYKPPTICDRYVYSTIAYSHLNFENSKRMVELSEIKKADLVFFLNISIETYKKRIEGRNIDEYEKNIEFMERVRERYLEMAKENFYAGKWIVLDGEDKVDKIHKRIKKELKNYLNL